MKTIHGVNLAEFDLNLLRVLDALFLEQHVGRAAARLKRSQPATSNALSRLREALGDPLFVRGRTVLGKFERRTKLQRNVVLFMPHYLVAPWILSTTDLLAAIPERVARRFAEMFPLQLVPLALPHDSLAIQQLWHPLRQHHPAHQWLREQVFSAARA